jgi:hypothetical protein
VTPELHPVKHLDRRATAGVLVPAAEGGRPVLDEATLTIAMDRASQGNPTGVVRKSQRACMQVTSHHVTRMAM